MNLESHLKHIRTYVNCNIDTNIGLNHSKFQNTLKSIDLFQQDPYYLEKYLNELIPPLVEKFHYGEVSNHNTTTNNQIAQIYYQFSKVCGFKKTYFHLSDNIYLLTPILSQLNELFNSGHTPSNHNWMLIYYLLSCLLLLVQSPFKLPNDSNVYSTIKNCESTYSRTGGILLVQPIISLIKAHLLSSNDNLFIREKNNLDLLTINYYLRQKLTLSSFVIPASFHDFLALENIKSWILQATTQNTSQTYIATLLKTLPKIGKFYVEFFQDFESFESLLNLCLDETFQQCVLLYTELRFKYARMIVKCLIPIQDIDTEGTYADVCNELIQIIISKILTEVNITHDELHLNLLLIAEFIRSQKFPQIVTSDDNELRLAKIIDKCIKFQNLGMNYNIEGRKIRDATNFLCWSISRSNKLPISLQKLIFSKLLCCAMFDVDLNIRRGAMAALQELLGRHSTTILKQDDIVQIIQLPVLNLKSNFIHEDEHSNISNILSVVEKECYRLDMYLEELIDWIINYNIGINYDYQIVKSSSTLISILLSTSNNAQHRLTSIIQENITNFESNSSNKFQHLYFISTIKPLLPDEKCTFIFDGITHKEFSNSKTAKTTFYYTAWLKYLSSFIARLNSEMTTVIIKSLKYFSDIANDESSGKEFLKILPQIIKHMENENNFISSNDYTKFWESFMKYLRFNNQLCFSLLPSISLNAAKFLDIIKNSNSESKSRFIESLSTYCLSTENSSFAIEAIIDSLDDYTLTTKGDVGRLVRTSAVRSISAHIPLFQKLIEESTEMYTSVVSKLLRISVEPLESLRLESLNVLLKLLAMDAQYVGNNITTNYNLLKFQKATFTDREIKRSFWKGYCFSGGALHSTDMQIKDSIDSFLEFYYTDLDINQKLETCNELIRIIPTGQYIKDWSQPYNLMGSPSERPISKVVSTLLKFWERILESGIDIDLPGEKFNYQGVFARFYNIQLTLRNNPQIKKQIIHACTLLAINSGCEPKLTKMVIEKLLQMLQQVANANGGSIKQCIIQNLILIFLDLERHDIVHKLNSNTIISYSASLLEELDF
ncbi:uncharacterized protein SCODWIG_02330 [Saccharomycodes ludwigii]|uniref:Tubulin-folding cofactor D ARM repeats domain-containing protein n=1 Tax=Saccharomycodes ludwigii TaxID=36035 RepID=A0A376B7N2_9ASCO|nr:hypothetical protein SCDLUD_003369 [Saccharomycodes ludwigii]KAH3900391.1 hypothetical protein SCDLUD_003369 [Saccharomycodes ludwigii]SSD60569.1 uncharacterized protein SCODWIG_02330 [Saccharomycodes ludwigii]